MTKQEFAIKLLFWLMPWPLSKAFPGLVLHILTGPAAATPLQWAQAAYDALAKQLSDATAYAHNLLETISDIPPTEQVTTSAAMLQTAIENATSLMRDLAEIMVHLQDFTPDQITQAFQHMVSAMEDITMAIDDLIHAIEQIPPEDRPEIPPPVYIPPEEVPEIPPIVEIPPEEIPLDELAPTPPPVPVPVDEIPPPVYVSPFPPIYPGIPGQGLTSPVYLPQKPTPRDIWLAYFDNTYWDPVAINWAWDGTKWVAQATMWYPVLTAIGTWATGFRPTQARITFTGSPDYMKIADAANFAHYVNASYTSGTEIDLDWTDQGAHAMTDIYGLTVGFMPSATRTITNIEFFEA